MTVIHREPFAVELSGERWHGELLLEERGRRPWTTGEIKARRLAPDPVVLAGHRIPQRDLDLCFPYWRPRGRTRAAVLRQVTHEMAKRRER